MHIRNPKEGIIMPRKQKERMQGRRERKEIEITSIKLNNKSKNAEEFLNPKGILIKNL